MWCSTVPKKLAVFPLLNLVNFKSQFVFAETWRTRPQLKAATAVARLKIMVLVLEKGSTRSAEWTRR